MTVRSNEFGVRRLENRRGGPLRPPIRGAHRGAPLHYSELFLRDRGFTLIEIIILIVMAGILLPTIIVPFVTAVKGSGQAEWANTSMYLAHYKMEEFMKFDYTNAALNPIALTGYANAPITGYQWQWERLYVDNNFNIVGNGRQAQNNNGYKRILVRVSDPDGNTYEVYSVVTDFQ